MVRRGIAISARPAGRGPGSRRRKLDGKDAALPAHRSEEHTSELQSLMRSSYAVFCLKKKKARQKRPQKLRAQDNTRTINEHDGQGTDHKCNHTYKKTHP